MTAEEAIREVESYMPKDEPMNAKDREAFFMAIKALKEAKTAWIPTYERLPELCVNIGTKGKPIMRSNPVYISYEHNGHNDVCPIPCVMESNGQWYNHYKSLADWVDLDDNHSRVDEPLCVRVTAWRPLMEPYKEESVEE